MRVIACVVALFAIGSCASRAIQVGPAPPAARARAHALAVKAYDRAIAAVAGDHDAFADAIALTKRAYAIDRDPVYLCNIGGFYKLIGDLPRAASFLGRCVQLLPATRPEELDRFAAVLADVEHDIGDRYVPILVDIQPAALISVSTFAPDELVPAPALVWLPVGTHTITAKVPGEGTRKRTIEITPAMLLARDHKAALVMR
jgi:hypothetical protein